MIHETVIGIYVMHCCVGINTRCSPAICHDTAFPLSSASPMDLPFVPAHVKSPSILHRRLSDLRILALEYRTAVLVCDVKGYASYVIAKGEVQVNRPGKLGSFKVGHHWQETSESPYSALGSTASLLLLLKSEPALDRYMRDRLKDTYHWTDYDGEHLNHVSPDGRPDSTPEAQCSRHFLDVYIPSVAKSSKSQSGWGSFSSCPARVRPRRA